MRRLKGLVVASPANPTGTMLLPDRAGRHRGVVRERGVQLVSDEIYHGIEYASPRPVAQRWETSREAVVFSSFSKYFSMTGWRIGWMLVPERLRRAVDILTGNFTICPPVIAQWACVAAFTEASYAELDGHVDRYAGNRRLLLDGLRLARHRPAGPGRRRVLRLRRRRAPHQDSMAFSRRLLAETGVAMAPGHRLRHRRRANRHVRLSFAGPRDDIRLGPRAPRRLASPEHLKMDATRGFEDHGRWEGRAQVLHGDDEKGVIMYGDTAASRKRVAQLREQSGDIRAAADRLVAQAESVPWHGRAAEAMRTRIKERANHLRVAAGHHETAADSLARHLTEVDTRKDAIESIRHKADSLTSDAADAHRRSSRPPTAVGQPTDEDSTLVAFVPPPAGHKDWLAVELPGL